MATASQGKPSGTPLDLQAYIKQVQGAGGVAPLSVYEGCFDALALKVCIRVELDQVCVDLYLVGNKVYSACVGLEVSDNVGRATIKSDTLNSGVWKLENPELVFEHFFVGNTGNCKFWARLYKLEGFPPDYVNKKEWNYDVVFTW